MYVFIHHQKPKKEKRKEKKRKETKNNKDSNIYFLKE